MRTRGSPFAAAFFVLVEQLGIVDHHAAPRGADVRVVSPISG